MERTQALAALSALAHGDRLDLVRLLVRTGPEGLPAGEIARRLGLSASRLSFHLSQMEQAGLVGSRRVARNVIYVLRPEVLGRMLGYLLQDCCAGHPEIAACCGTGAPDLPDLPDERRGAGEGTGAGEAEPSGQAAGSAGLERAGLERAGWPGRARA